MTAPPKNPWIERRRQEAAARRRKLVQAYGRQDRLDAWAAVEEAVRSGVLVKAPCQVGAKGCEGPRAPAHFHHTMGYEPEHRLTGVWACRACHNHLHRLQVAQERRKEAQDRLQEVVRGAPGLIVLEDKK